MGFYEFFFRVVMTINALIVFLFSLFMTFVACTNDVYPWKRAWPYVTFGWATCAWLYWLGMAK